MATENTSTTKYETMEEAFYRYGKQEGRLRSIMADPDVSQSDKDAAWQGVLRIQRIFD